MINEIAKLTGSLSESFKKRFYGSTFRCPVCHLELAHADVNDNGLVVCPLCGVVMDVERVMGHTVPVVNDVELYRPQPKLRIHPLATHLPIGLFPFAVVAVAVVFAASVANTLLSKLPEWIVALIDTMPMVADTALVLLVVSVAASTVTFASGYWDWKRRYRGRPYRIVSLKITFAIVFLALGAGAVALHASGFVFAAETGLIDLASMKNMVIAIAYVGMLAMNLIVLSTLGHVGGNLVFGK
jgi:hypothetical protein